MLRQLRVGDLLFIKSFPPGGKLTIKAVGIIRQTDVPSSENSGCVLVDWWWKGEIEVHDIDDKYNVRRITLFEGFNPKVQRLVIDALVGETDEGERIDTASTGNSA